MLIYMGTLYKQGAHGDDTGRDKFAVYGIFDCGRTVLDRMNEFAINIVVMSMMNSVEMLNIRA